VFSFIGLAIAVIWLIGGVVALVLGHFRQAFFGIVAGAGFTAIFGYQRWYGRNSSREETDGSAGTP